MTTVERTEVRKSRLLAANQDPDVAMTDTNTVRSSGGRKRGLIQSEWQWLTHGMTHHLFLDNRSELGPSCSPEGVCHCLETWLSCEGGDLLASIGWRPGTLLNIWESTRQPSHPPPHNKELPGLRYQWCPAWEPSLGNGNKSHAETSFSVNTVGISLSLDWVTWY